MTSRKSGRLVGVVAALLGMLALPAQAAGEAHVTGTGAVSQDGCATLIDIHATEVGHTGQYLELKMGCGAALTEISVAGSADCIVQVGSTVHLAYFDESVRLTITDGGMAADQVGVSLDPFKKARKKNKCRTKSLSLSSAVGDFATGMP